MKKPLFTRLLPASLLLLALIMNACNPTSTTTILAPTSTQTLPQASSTPKPTSTPVPQAINICTAQEPGSLYPYSGEDTPSRRTILSALDDGRFESVLSGNDAGLLTAYPQLGDMISVAPVTVSAGDVIVDAFGDVAVLQKGSKVRPYPKCSADDCAITWDGSSELKMDQVVVNFKLNTAEKWSDGTPLTSADYLFSYQIMQQASQPADQKRLEVTQSLTAKDDYTVEWKGLPGFGGISLEQFLPLPMPEHQLTSQKAEDLGSIPFYREQTLSWGAYQIKLWEQGVGLTLEANPNYYRTAEGLPKIEQMKIRFVPDLSNALDLLQSGECDVLDSSYNFLSMKKADWQPHLNTTDIHLSFDGQAVEMVFGIQPAVYDVDYQAAISARPDWFGDPNTREALSLAITQAQLNQAIYGQHLPESVQVPPASIFGPGVKFESLLDEAGWKLVDGARTAQGVAGVIDGTTFKVTLLTSQSQADQEIGALVVSALGKLGIKVSTQALPLDQLYAPGPDGPLFGRNFDLALVSWQSDPVNCCATYMSKAIPSSSNHWIGTNMAGLNDEAFDLACGANLVSFEPTSSTNAGARCVGICALFLQQSPSVKVLVRINIWVSSKALKMESDWTLDQIELMTKTDGN